MSKKYVIILSVDILFVILLLPDSFIMKHFEAWVSHTVMVVTQFSAYILLFLSYKKENREKLIKKLDDELEKLKTVVLAPEFLSFEFKENGVTEISQTTSYAIAAIKSSINFIGLYAERFDYEQQYRRLSAVFSDLCIFLQEQRENPAFLKESKETRHYFVEQISSQCILIEKVLFQ